LNFNFVAKTLIILSLSLCFSFTNISDGQSKQSARDFKKQFQIFTKSNDGQKGNWLDKTSPWAPYFNSIITLERTKEQISWEREGRCQKVLTAIQAGFIKAQPKLAVIFFKQPIRLNFERVIIPYHSPSYKRCQIWKNLNLVIETSKRANVDLNAPFVDLPLIFLKEEKKTKKPSQKKMKPADLKLLKIYKKAMVDLISLATCKNDKMALKDINELDTMSYSKVFTETEAYFLDALAQLNSVKTNLYKNVKIRLSKIYSQDRASYDPQKLFSLQTHLQNNEMEKAKKLVPNLTRFCK
jgi:hypothetical protein